jgi:hypothetical protein
MYTASEIAKEMKKRKDTMHCDSGSIENARRNQEEHFLARTSGGA